MYAKDIRKAVISLLVLAAGVKIVMVISSTQLTGFNISGMTDIIKSVDALGNLLLLVLVPLAIILIPVYVYKRRQEKGAKQIIMAR